MPSRSAGDAGRFAGLRRGVHGGRGEQPDRAAPQRAHRARAARRHLDAGSDARGHQHLRGGQVARRRHRARMRFGTGTVLLRALGHLPLQRRRDLPDGQPARCTGRRWRAGCTRSRATRRSSTRCSRGPSLVRQPYRELLDIFIGEHTRALHRASRSTAKDSSVTSRSRPLNTVERDVPRPPPGGARLLRRRAAARWSRAGACRAHRTASRARRAAARGRAPRRGRARRANSRRCSRAAPAQQPMRRARRRQRSPGCACSSSPPAMAGPWIGRFMAWCGADVIKVESKAYPDVTRLYIPPREPERGIQPQLSPWFTDWNAGKRFVSLDLAAPEGAALARRLVACQRRGDRQQQHAACSRSSGSASTRSQRARSRHSCCSAAPATATPVRITTTSAGARTSRRCRGSRSVSGFPARECTMTQFAYPDPLSALHGLCAILAALEHRARTGAGQRIDLAQLEATVASFGHLVLESLRDGREPARLGNASLGARAAGLLPLPRRGPLVRDRGRRREPGWQRFCALTGQPGMAPTIRASRDARARRAHAAELDCADRRLDLRRAIATR